MQHKKKENKKSARQKNMKSATWKEWIIEICKILLHCSKQMDNRLPIGWARSGIKTDIQDCLNWNFS